MTDEWNFLKYSYRYLIMQRYPRHECKSNFSVWLLSNFFLQTKMVWIGKIKPDKNHCKLTRRRRSISIDITVTAL